MNLSLNKFLIFIANFFIASKFNKTLLLLLDSACIEKLLKNSAIEFLESSESTAKIMFNTAKNCTETSPLQSCVLKFWYRSRSEITSFIFLKLGILPFGIVTKYRLPGNQP